MVGGPAALAWADGGFGGLANDYYTGIGAFGGTGFAGMPGENARSFADNGGGGGGAGGGPGGLGFKNPDGGGNGGAGGFNGNGMGQPLLANTGGLAGSNGQDGLTGNNFFPGDPSGGGGGGAGGYGAIVTGAGASSNSGIIVGGNGGNGGSKQGNGSGGGGGDGGVGVQFTAAGASLTNGGVIAAGNGGNGQSGKIHGNNGGNGGIGVNFGASGGTLINSYRIVGGNGGSAGGSGIGGSDGTPGAGGAGVVGSGLTIINSGTIIGGLGANGTRANAITFTGGTNTLILQPGSSITGNVVAFSAVDTLALGGSGMATFDVSQIGPAGQYQNFGQFQKIDSGTWFLANATPNPINWTMSGGVLAISSDGNLGGFGSLTFNGGTLQTNASFFSSRPITLESGSGTIAPAAGTALTLLGNISGPGGLTMVGAGTLVLAGVSSYSGPTNIQAGTLQASGVNNILSAASAFTISSGAALDLGGTTQTIGSLSGSGTVTNSGSRLATLAAGGNNTSTTFSGTLQDGNAPLALVKTGSGTMTLTGTNGYSGGTTVLQGTLVGNSASLQGDIANNASLVFDQSANGTYAGAISGSGSLTKAGVGTLYVTGNSTYSGATAVQTGRLQVTGGNNVLSANSAFTISSGAALDLGGTQQAIGSLTGGGTVTNTGSAGATLATNGNNASTRFDGSLRGDTLALVKAGTGTLNLLGNNSYGGGTVVQAGILQGNTNSLQGSIVNNALLVFHQDIAGTYSGGMSGAGGVHVRGGGTLTVTGTNTYTGPTSVLGSTLVVNGSLASSVTADATSAIGGSGGIGGLIANGSSLRPGNSIGTLSVTGAMVQNGGIYQLEVDGQGRSDRINVGGTAQLNGGTVQIEAAQGSYANSTTYTIVNAAGGLSGSYSAISHDFAFLTPSLSYDANNAYLTLALQGPSPFSGGGGTPNQQATGSGLDQIYATASGDMATVIGALAGLRRSQGRQALETLSGQPWADMGTMNLAGAAMFMNALGQQMATARGVAMAAGPRQALAQACDVAACEPASPLSIWGSGLGGFGTVAGDSNAAALTYNQFGGAVGIDYRVDPRFLVGLGVGYGSGTMWVNNFLGNGWTSTVSAAAYASFTQSGFYADLLAGYGYANNQMQRQIVIPNLQPRTASGSTGANQFLGQAEIGWRVPVYAPAQASVTPFARFQAVSSMQNAFSEWGANSISLNVAQQTTNAVRSTLGADLAGAIPLGGEQRQLDVALRLGWMHEYAYLGRPMTAAFAGAPSAAFTVYGATPPTDYAVIGLTGDIKVADSAQVYLRYDGQLSTGADSHAVTAGLRITW